MTLKDKIKNLTWADLIRKLKDIFSDIDSKVSTLEEKVNVPTISNNPQDLKSVLDNGTYAEFEGGFINSATILGGDEYERNVTFNVDNGLPVNSGNEGAFFLLENSIMELQTYNDLSRGTVASYSGEVELSKFNKTNNKKTTVLFTNPTQTTTLRFPAPALPGTYTLARESAISGTFLNPTSITVTNGIITAIS